MASLTACSGYRPGGIGPSRRGISKVLLFSEARDDAFSAREDAQRRLEGFRVAWRSRSLNGPGERHLHDCRDQGFDSK